MVCCENWPRVVLFKRCGTAVGRDVFADCTTGGAITYGFVKMTDSGVIIY